MTCIHLRQLYTLCNEHDLKIGGTDLIRIVCKQCGEQEVCPSMLMEEYEEKLLAEESQNGPQSKADSQKNG